MLSSIVTAFISPLGTSLCLGLLGLLLLRLRGARLRGLGLALSAFSLAWLWAWSTPLASEALRGSIEAKAGPRRVAEVPAAPVIVVLGGGTAGPRPPLRFEPDLGAAADRMWHAARLYHAGKAPRILLTGGASRSGDGPEAQAMRSFLVDLGVPASAMVLEEASIDTASNAALSARILARERVDRIILVTSALHMPRARQAFERAGLKVQPAPTDFEVIRMPFDLLRVLPEGQALAASGRAFKELVGLALGR